MDLDKHNMHGQLGVDPAEKFSGGENLLPKHLISRWLLK